MLTYNYPVNKGKKMKKKRLFKSQEDLREKSPWMDESNRKHILKW